MTPQGAADRRAIDAIDTVVVIYAENRSFDNLFGLFPGANGIPGVNQDAAGALIPQVDRDGSPLATLPPTWGGLTEPKQALTVTEAETVGMPNRPFRLDGPNAIAGRGVVVPLDIATRDLVHRYYSNIMQINGGRNDGFAAWSNAGGLTMGYYDGSGLAMWQVARRYTLADNFFMGAFGGSFLNHQYLVCACIPEHHPNADARRASPAKALIADIESADAQGRFVRLRPTDKRRQQRARPVRRAATASTARSVAEGCKRHVLPAVQHDAAAVSAEQRRPRRQRSALRRPGGGDDAATAEAGDDRRPARCQGRVVGRVRRRLEGGERPATREARGIIYNGVVQFQPHHQPFNYFAAFDPASRAAYRAAHLKDFDSEFLADAAAGRLPAVTFYKPQGNLNQHPGYANVSDGDAHIASVVAALEKSPQWPHMLVVVTYDENGGFWDHAPVPKGDRWGPATRVPTIIISPFAKKGFIDKTPYDTASILRFVTRRWNLEPLPGVALRDRSLVAHGSPPMGDLSAALEAPR